jgi:hypothetical protein
MIYVGSQYFRAPTPKEQDWERDIKQAKEYGLDYFRDEVVATAEVQYDAQRCQS